MKDAELWRRQDLVAISGRMCSCQGWDRSLPQRGLCAATLILDCSSAPAFELRRGVSHDQFHQGQFGNIGLKESEWAAAWPMN
jgi:hypothetical protein